jgi:hypothetical protein
MAVIGLVLPVAALVLFTALTMAFVGWPLARRARGYADPAEQVVLSLLCGQGVLFALEAAVYIAAVPGSVVAAGTVLLLAGSGAGFVADLRRGRVAPLGAYAAPVLAWVGLAFLTLAATTPLAVHGVPGALYDWYEHYRRAEIFLHRLPPETNFNSWTLAARGPLFNALAAVFMKTAGTPAYWGFSVPAALLNGQVILPMALLLRRFAGLSLRAALAVSAGVLLVVPALHWNLVFTWPKLAAANWILASLALSLAGVERRESRLVGWGVAAMALAFLAHFLAFLYAVVLLPCWIYYALARKLSPRPLLAGAAAGGLLAGGWMLYLVFQFGVEGTLRANSTLGSYRGRGPEMVMGLNFAATVLPPPVRALGVFRGSPLAAPPSPQEVTVLADGRTGTGPGQGGSVFLLSQLEGAVGWTGLALLLVACVLEVRAWAKGPPLPFFGFWCYFVLVGVPVNLWAVRWYEAGGVLNQNLQPYLCLAAVWVVARFAALPLPARAVAAGAWALECVARVSYIISYQTVILPVHKSAGGVAFKGSFTVAEDYWSNYWLKTVQDVAMLRDLVPGGTAAAVAAVALAAAGVLCLLAPVGRGVLARREGGKR